MEKQDELIHILKSLKERRILPQEALEQIQVLKNKQTKTASAQSELDADTICSYVASIVGFSLTPQSKKLSLAKLGIDSIFAARIMDHLNKTCGLNLPPPTIFEFSNLQEFAEHVVRQSTSTHIGIASNLNSCKSGLCTANLPTTGSNQSSFDDLWNRCKSDLDMNTDAEASISTILEPVVFLSGLGCKMEMLSKVFLAFSKKRKTFIYAPPGHTEHDDSAALKTIGDLVEHFKSFLDENELSGPIHLVGWSLGGIIAQYFTCIYPSMVKTLSIVCSSVRALNESSLFSRSFEEFSFMKEKNIPIPDDLFLMLSAEYLESYKNILSTFDCSSFSSQIQCPVLIINVANDKIMHTAHHHDLTKYYSNAHIATIKQNDIGHFGIYTHSSHFINELQQFLDLI